MHVVRTYVMYVKYRLEIFDIELLIHMVRLAYDLYVRLYEFIRSTCYINVHQLINLHLIKRNLS